MHYFIRFVWPAFEADELASCDFGISYKATHTFWVLTLPGQNPGDAYVQPVFSLSTCDKFNLCALQTHGFCF